MELLVSNFLLCKRMRVVINSTYIRPELRWCIILISLPNIFRKSVFNCSESLIKTSHHGDKSKMNSQSILCSNVNLETSSDLKVEKLSLINILMHPLIERNRSLIGSKEDFDDITGIHSSCQCERNNPRSRTSK